MDRVGPPAFSLLDPGLQEQLFQMRWTELRPIQVDAIHEILGGSRHLLIMAQTAGGKTEAAFLPILSLLVQDPGKSIHSLYVSPLKALINDQFRRLGQLCESMDIPVHRWHGDVSRAHKQELLRSPSGVLLITPESLESLLINHPAALGRIFGDLRFAVIDELHAFLGSERGAHLRSLLSRVLARTGKPVRKVALSATIGDPAAAARWLSPPDGNQVLRIEDLTGKTIRLSVRGYLRSQPIPRGGHEGEEPGEGSSDGEEMAEPLSSPSQSRRSDRQNADDLVLVEDLIRCFHGKTALIFGNSKPRLELLADLVRRYQEIHKQPCLFRIHHGSLSRSEREETEEALRSDIPTATFCTSTLELGIDIGNIAEIGQIGPPWSVSALAQRMGRSGRHEGEPSVMRLFVEEERPAERSGLVDRIFPSLLQGVAMTELMLEGWCEPPETDRLHLSTLVQQTLSCIAERGGISAAGLFDMLVSRGGFRKVSRKMLVDVLHSLGEAELIEQDPDGVLILGMQGERIVRGHDFYAAFLTEMEYRVVHQGHSIGTIPASPSLMQNGFLILAGRRWKILEIDSKRLEISVEPSRAGQAPMFSSASPGDIHPLIRARMKQTLLGSDMPRYLDPTAREMLASARKTALQNDLDQSEWVDDDGFTLWLTWDGTRVNRTLMAIALRAGLRASEEPVGLRFEGVTMEEARMVYRQARNNPPNPLALARGFPMIVREKYDGFLSEPLLVESFARDHLDAAGAMQRLGA